MAIDSETTAAFEVLMDRVGAKIDTANTESARRTSGLHKKIDTNADNVRETIDRNSKEVTAKLEKFGLELNTVVTEFSSHEKQQEKDLEAIGERIGSGETRITKGEDERVGLWKILAVGGGGGGLLGLVAGWFAKLKGG